MDDDDDLTPEIIGRISAMLDAEKAEIDEFFSFPDWYPAPVKVTYQILLSNLLSNFRNRWPDQFAPDHLRIWIDRAKEFFADPTNDQAGNFDREPYKVDFGPLELTLIHELSRCEYGACLPATKGLEFLADKDAAEGHKIQRQRSDKGKKSGVTRSEQRDERNKRIVAWVRTLAGNFDRGEWAKRAARNFKCSEVTARKAIREGGLYEVRQVVKRKKIKKID
jgi:hypothetical protein